MTWLPMSGLFVAWLSWLLAGFKLILKFHGWICKWRNKKSTRNRNNSFHIAAYFERCNLLKYLERNCSLFSTQLHQVSLYIEQCKTPWQLRNFEPEQIWSDHTSRLQMIFESYSYWASMVLMLKKNGSELRDHEETYMYQFSSVTQSCATLWDPMDCSMPRIPVPQQLPEFSQTRVHWANDAIQPSNPLSLLSLPAFNLSQHQGLIKWVSSSYQVARIGVSASTSVLQKNIQDWSPLGWTGWISLQSKGLSRVFSDTTVQKHQFFRAQLSLWSKSHIHTWLLEKPYLWL